MAAPESLAVLEDQRIWGLTIITAELDFLNTKKDRLALVFSLIDIDTNRWEETTL